MTPVDYDKHIANIHNQGYTIVPGVLTPSECDTALDELERLSAQRARGGFECLFNKARIFERVYQVAPLLRLVRHFLGADAILSSAHGSILEPGAGGGDLHADGELTGHLRARSLAPADRGKRIIGHVLGLNTIFCISEFTTNNGATRLVPGSHHEESGEIPTTAVDDASIVEACRGSTIVFNTNIWHGSSKNRSHSVRFALLVPWRRSWERPEYELCRIVQPDVLERAGADGKFIFGIDVLPPYLERWQWDRDSGTPKPEFAQLARK